MFQQLIGKAKEIYGSRLIDGNCSFCNKKVTTYCDCVESQKINAITKRINDKITLYENFKLMGITVDLLTKSGVPIKYADVKIEDYQTESDNQKEIIKQMQEYQNNFILNYLTGWNMLLIGNYGTAKTFLMSALCNYFNKNKYESRFINMADLADEVKSTFRDGTPKTADDVIESFTKIDFLFLDDIDKETPSEFIKNLAYKIVNQRYNDIKPTIISANTSLSKLDCEYFGEATISRIKEKSTIVYFKSENWRMK